jgi:hypothetical protein
MRPGWGAVAAKVVRKVVGIGTISVQDEEVIIAPVTVAVETI